MCWWLATLHKITSTVEHVKDASEEKLGFIYYLFHSFVQELFKERENEFQLGTMAIHTEVNEKELRLGSVAMSSVWKIPPPPMLDLLLPKNSYHKRCRRTRRPVVKLLIYSVICQNLLLTSWCPDGAIWGFNLATHSGSLNCPTVWGLASCTARGEGLCIPVLHLCVEKRRGPLS